jgi:hypothetical protein
MRDVIADLGESLARKQTASSLPARPRYKQPVTAAGTERAHQTTPSSG